jgi:hypothetical protein
MFFSSWYWIEGGDLSVGIEFIVWSDSDLAMQTIR